MRPALASRRYSGRLRPPGSASPHDVGPACSTRASYEACIRRTVSECRPDRVVDRHPAHLDVEPHSPASAGTASHPCRAAWFPLGPGRRLARAATSILRQGAGPPARAASRADPSGSRGTSLAQAPGRPASDRSGGPARGGNSPPLLLLADQRTGPPAISDERSGSASLSVAMPVLRSTYAIMVVWQAR